jgi:hypothetical membrane protein
MLGRVMEERRWLKWGASAGLVGPVVFIATFTVEGALRPEYHPLAMYISALSLGPRGWVQIANFMVVGSLLLVFAVRLAGGKTSRAAGVLYAVIAVGLFASAPFVMDPMCTPRMTATAHGMVHEALGAIVFTAMPIACFVLSRRFRNDPRWRPWTLAAGTIIVCAIVLMKLGQLSSSALTPWLGLLQRIAVITFLVWTFSLALKLIRPGA